MWIDRSKYERLNKDYEKLRETVLTNLQGWYEKFRKLSDEVETLKRNIESDTKYNNIIYNELVKANREKYRIEKEYEEKRNLYDKEIDKLIQDNKELQKEKDKLVEELDVTSNELYDRVCDIDEMREAWKKSNEEHKDLEHKYYVNSKLLELVSNDLAAACKILKEEKNDVD